MPRITRLFIRSGMIYFLAGIILALIADLPDVSTGALLLPVYWHMIVIPWITQLIMGFSISTVRGTKRGKTKQESSAPNPAFWCLHIVLPLRFLAEPFLPFYFNESWIVRVIMLSSFIPIAASGFYTAETWPRVRPPPTTK